MNKLLITFVNMKRQILLLAIGILGACSLHAQETQDSLMQTSQEAAKTSKARKSTDWSKQPIGYVFGGVGVGHIVSSEEGATGVNMNTGLDWRVGMSRFYKRWGWGVVVQQFRAKETFHIINGMESIELNEVGKLLYVAPQFTGRWVLGRRLTVYGAVGWGWMRYMETLKTTGMGNYKATANAFAGNFKFGISYRLNSVIGWSVDAGLVGAEIGKPKVNNAAMQEEIDRNYEGKMDASRLYLTIGAQIYIWKR